MPTEIINLDKVTIEKMTQMSSGHDKLSVINYCYTWPDIATAMI